jgi:preprotein translocase subunit SecE
MGRLQRKKTSKKKKIQNSTTTSSPQVKDDAATENTAFLAGSSRDTKKLQVLSLKKPSRVPKPVSRKQKQRYLDKVLQFLRETKVELKKVTWPSRKQTIGSTVVVIVLVMIISLFLGVADIGLSSLVRVVLQ